MMIGLRQEVKFTLDEITERTVSVCKEFPSVMAAYIFGSVVKPLSRKPNDVDVAILLSREASADFPLLDFITRIEEKLKCRADVIILNRAGQILKRQIRKEGVVIFDRDPDYRRKFEIYSRKTYEDFLYLHNRYVKKVLYGGFDG